MMCYTPYLASDVSCMAIQYRGVTLLDLSRVVQNDDLKKKRGKHVIQIDCQLIKIDNWRRSAGGAVKKGLRMRFPKRPTFYAR